MFMILGTPCRSRDVFLTGYAVVAQSIFIELAAWQAQKNQRCLSKFPD